MKRSNASKYSLGMKGAFEYTCAFQPSTLLSVLCELVLNLAFCTVVSLNGTLIEDKMYPLPLNIRGLQCFKLNGNLTEKDRYWQKNNFLLFAKSLKMYSFFRICI